MRLQDNNSFDEYARQRGWAYDNAGRYRSEDWDWYAGPVAGVVLLRRAPDRVALVRFDGLNPTELWSGRVSSPEEFDEMIRAAGLQR
jgi:hypothetical protein